MCRKKDTKYQSHTYGTLACCWK